MSNMLKDSKMLIAALLAIVAIGYFVFENKKIVENPKGYQQVENKEAVQEVVKNYIMNNPDIIIASLEEMQKRKIKEMKDRVQSLIKGKKNDLENSLYSPFIGNEKGDVNIVLFYDYNCSYCKKANTIINELISTDAGVKVIFKPLPILGEASEYAAKIAVAVFNLKPELFKAFHDDMMSLSTITREEVTELVRRYDINYADLEETMDKPEIKGEVQKVKDLASELEISGAPAFIINGHHYSGLLEIDKLHNIIRNIRTDFKPDSKDSSVDPALKENNPN